MSRVHGPIELHVEPGVSMDWATFQREAPPFSIALDGYVIGPPAFAAGPYANFDHHAGVDRLATRSTCMQVFLAIMLGLYSEFQKNGRPHAHVFVNDADQDTCLAIWLLCNPERLREMSLGQSVTTLLITEDILDCTGGAYPVSPDHLSIREQAWIFEPYMRARMEGRMACMDAETMHELIDEVCARITQSADETHETIELDARYEEVGGGPGWRLIIEHGAHARSALFAAGIRAFVSVRERADGAWTYSIGRMSPFIAFPLGALYTALNEAEGTPPGPGG